MRMTHTGLREKVQWRDDPAESVSYLYIRITQKFLIEKNRDRQLSQDWHLTPSQPHRNQSG